MAATHEASQGAELSQCGSTHTSAVTGYWMRACAWVRQRTDATVSHAYCPRQIKGRGRHLNFIIWLIVGGLLGWGASLFTGTHSRQGFILNVVVGIVGMLIGAMLLSELLALPMFSLGEFSITGLLVSLLGATLLLTVVALLRIQHFHPMAHYLSEITEVNKTSRAIPGPFPLIAVALMGMLITACASAPPAPDSAMDAAKVAISNAEKAEAGQFAGAELGEARDKLALADSAVHEENMVVAERFAQESRVQAELASARTAAAKAAAVNKEMERGADALTEEMQRAGEPR